MKHPLKRSPQPPGHRFGWTILCLMLTVLVGCQSMLKSKAKAKLPHDKFSCGEPLPGQIP